MKPRSFWCLVSGTQLWRVSLILFCLGPQSSCQPSAGSEASLLFSEAVLESAASRLAGLVAAGTVDHYNAESCLGAKVSGSLANVVDNQEITRRVKWPAGRPSGAVGKVVVAMLELGLVEEHMGPVVEWLASIETKVVAKGCRVSHVLISNSSLVDATSNKACASHPSGCSEALSPVLLNLFDNPYGSLHCRKPDDRGARTRALVVSVPRSGTTWTHKLLKAASDSIEVSGVLFAADSPTTTAPSALFLTTHFPFYGLCGGPRRVFEKFENNNETCLVRLSRSPLLNADAYQRYHAFTNQRDWGSGSLGAFFERWALFHEYWEGYTVRSVVLDYDARVADPAAALRQIAEVCGELDDVEGAVLAHPPALRTDIQESSRRKGNDPSEVRRRLAFSVSPAAAFKLAERHGPLMLRLGYDADLNALLEQAAATTVCDAASCSSFLSTESALRYPQDTLDQGRRAADLHIVELTHVLSDDGLIIVAPGLSH